MKHKEILGKFRKKRVSSILDPFAFLIPPSIQDKRFFNDLETLEQILKRERLYSKGSVENLQTTIIAEIPGMTVFLYLVIPTIITAFGFVLSPYTQIDILKSAADPDFPRYIDNLSRAVGAGLFLIAAGSMVIYLFFKISYQDEARLISLLRELSIRLSRK